MEPIQIPTLLPHFDGGKKGEHLETEKKQLIFLMPGLHVPFYSITNKLFWLQITTLKAPDLSSY